MFRRIITILTIIIVLVPIIYALVLSFIPNNQIITNQIHSFTFKNYIKVLNNWSILNGMYISMVTSVLATIIRLTIVFLASYAYCYTNIKGRKIIYGLLLATMLIPPDILLIQNYLTITKLNLINTNFAIISTLLFGSTQLLLQKQFFSTLPVEYFHMAEIDGCKDNQIMRKILIPLSMPIITIIAVQTFINVFNNYLWPLLVTNNNNKRTLQVLLTMLDYKETLQYGSLASSVVIASILTIILLLATKKTMIQHISKYQMLS